MCGVLTDYTLSSEWRHMKSQVIQKPVVVILGNAGNIGYLAAKAFACQGTVVAMLHEAGEESCHIVDCLPGSSHLVMSGRLNHSSDLASFAGLVHTLYGRVDYLIICEDASVEENCLNRRDVRMSQIVIHRPVFRYVSQSRLASSACAAALFLCGNEGRHIHREYIVVNGRKAAWRPGRRPESFLSLFNSCLEFCSICSRMVFQDA